MSAAVTIVVFHSDPVQVGRALEALAQSAPAPGLVLIHVNDDDGSWSCGLPAGLPVQLSRSAANLGFAAGQNLLLRRAFDAGATMAVVHNPDVTLAPGALEALLEAAAANPRRLFGPVLERADARDGKPTGLADTLGIQWTRDGRHLDAGQGEPLPAALAARRVAGISGACLAVPRDAHDAVRAVGGEFFDEDFIAYREDAELSLRAEALGVQSWLVPAARGLHVRAQRGTSRGRNAQIDLLGVRNRFLIAFKWGLRRPGWAPAVLLRDVVVIFAVVLRERSSLPGLAQAWRLRRRMRDKRAVLQRALAGRRGSSL